MTITGIKTTHGELVLEFGHFSRTVKPGPGERVGWGAIGFKSQLDGMTVVNPDDETMSKGGVEKTGAKCVILHNGESIDI